MNEVSDMNGGGQAPALEHLQTKALRCLDSFPSKVMELNNMIDSFTPSSAKSKSSTVRRVQRSGMAVNPIQDVNDTDAISSCSSYSLSSIFDTSRRTIFKRRYYRGSNRYSFRKKPGPLGMILTYLASNFVKCTKTLLIDPSWYIISKVVTILTLRRKVAKATCCEPLEWQSSTPVCPGALNEDNSAISNFINVMRPAAVQLIGDTKILKKWLQALSLNLAPDLPTCLVKAVRTTETIDCWAYELFFKLKTCQSNRKKNAAKAAELGLKMNDDMEYQKLWHQIIELRNNYVILYDALRHEKKFQELIVDKP